MSITFRPDTSFPYLKIAREYGVDYGDVVRCAESWSRKTKMHPQELASFHRLHDVDGLMDAIITAVDAEYDRRRDVRHGRDQ